MKGDMYIAPFIHPGCMKGAMYIAGRVYEGCYVHSKSANQPPLQHCVCDTSGDHMPGRSHISDRNSALIFRAEVRAECWGQAVMLMYTSSMVDVYIKG